ncbi:heavy-metal-associated domain-containing protein [Brachyspira alvinipulli]|uniref:heavy-metal-associated domain-containing protein n=1 Tax=Brachyspira alvinipulli TaxID=84379 RepID=UPI0004846AE8|nr:heavy-metal-associated domain-containing protein [Brachyspira alvinipulli]
MKNVTIKINGMGCQNCVKAVTEELSSIEGISKVNVSLENACAEVEYDESKVNTDKMISAIKELEYEASL